MSINSSSAEPSTEPNYRLNCGQYVLHRGDQPVGPVLDEVALALTRDEGVLHKHGAVEGVTQWAEKTRTALRAQGALGEELAKEIIVISGRFPVDELNNCLTTSGYVLRMLKGIEEGTLSQEPVPFA